MNTGCAILPWLWGMPQRAIRLSARLKHVSLILQSWSGSMFVGRWSAIQKCRTGTTRPAILLRDEMFAVVFQLLDGFADVIQRLVRVLFHQAIAQARLPALHQFLDGTDVEIAVMKPGFELRHGAREKTPVLTDAVAAHGRLVFRDMELKEFKRQALHVRLVVC